MLKNRLGDVSLMSHTLRRMQRPDQKHLHIIRDDQLPTFWSEGRLPSPPEQTDNLILWIADNQVAPHAWAQTTQSAIAAMVGIVVSPDGKRQWWMVVAEYGTEFKGTLQASSQIPSKLLLQLELAGEKYEALKKERIESRIVFHGSEIWPSGRYPHGQ